MGKEIISSQNAPAAIGPYSQAIKVGNFIYASGQLGVDPQTGNLVGDNVQTQTEQVFKNIKSVLEAAGASLQNVVKATVFLADMNDFVEMNKVYAEKFGDNRPARSTVQVARLPKDGLVEIEVVAVVD